MVVLGKSIAELGFYPFEDVRWAHEELWTEISKRCTWVAPHLTLPNTLWVTRPS